MEEAIYREGLEVEILRGNSEIDQLVRIHNSLSPENSVITKSDYERYLDILKSINRIAGKIELYESNFELINPEIVEIKKYLEGNYKALSSSLVNILLTAPNVKAVKSK